MKDTYTSQSSTTSPSASLSTLSSSSSSQQVTFSGRMNQCSSSSQSNLSSSYPSGKVSSPLDRSFLFFLTVQSHKTISLLMKMSPLCRNGPRHPGALRRHTQCPLHQRTWGRRRHRGSWLAELHHLHWNVLRCCRPPICLHLQRVPGEKEWSARWERWSLPLALVKFVDMFQC